MKVDPNQPAFPRVEHTNTVGVETGIPLRLYIAAQVAAARVGHARSALGLTAEIVADEALDISDALIARHNETVREEAETP